MIYVLKKVFDLFASYGLAVILLFLLLLLVLFGTLEQVDHGLFEVQKKYFESFWLVHWLFGKIPIPLPGVYLLLTLLFINLLCGAIIRAPKSWRRPGLLIAHFGILFLIFSGFVTYHFSINGHMTLFEGQQSDEFQSYYDWEIVIAETQGNPTIKQWIIPGDRFQYLKPNESKTFYAQGLPFEFELTGFLRNCAPIVQGDGITLRELPLEKEAERNIAGVFVQVKGEDGTLHPGLLWGMQQSPWVVTVAGKSYSLDLRHQRWQLPFTIVLNKFKRELHPRTNMASNFESEVTKIEDGVERRINIRMNEPLRHKGYTFFQASWGPQDAGPNDRLFSVFAVAKNPADHWPLYACIVIASGLILHFTQTLFRYLRRQRRIPA